MNIIVVVDNKWGIGRNNGLLFRLKKDMKRFRETTIGKVIVVGANTFASFKNGALPNRVNVVLDSSGARHEGTVSVSNVDDLREELARYNGDDVYVAGGAAVYKLMLNECKTAYVTKVKADGGAQVFFPNLDELANWVLAEQSEEIEDGEYTITFCKYVNADLA